MAKFTITVMGIKDEERIMNLIMQYVSREGKYELIVKDKVDPEDLMANKLVSYGVLTRKQIRNFPLKADIYEYNEGENFAKANLIGAQKFIIEENKTLDPSNLKQIWNSISNNALISGIIGAAIGSLITWFLT